MLKNTIRLSRGLGILILVFLPTITFSQTGFKNAILDESCAEIFNKFIKPGHVINFESPEAELDGKFILLKEGNLHFVEADATPRNSSKLTLNTIANKGLIAMRDEKGELLAKLKIEVIKKVKTISCQ